MIRLARPLREMVFEVLVDVSAVERDVLFVGERQGTAGHGKKETVRPVKAKGGRS